MAPFSRAFLNLTIALFVAYFSSFGELAGASFHGSRGEHARALIGHGVKLPRTLLRPLGWSASFQSPYQAGATDTPTVFTVQHTRVHTLPSPLPPPPPALLRPVEVLSLSLVGPFPPLGLPMICPLHPIFDFSWLRWPRYSALQ